MSPIFSVEKNLQLPSPCSYGVQFTSFSTPLLPDISVAIHNFLRKKLKVFSGKAPVQRF